MKKGDLKYPDRDFLNRKEKLQEELIFNQKKLIYQLDKQPNSIGREWREKVEGIEEEIKILTSQLAELKEEEQQPEQSAEEIKCKHREAYRIGGRTSKCPECECIILPNGNAVPDETPSKAHKFLWDALDTPSRETIIDELNCWDYILKAMQEYRQQGMPTEEEIRDAAIEYEKTIGNIHDFKNGVNYVINKWKGE